MKYVEYGLILGYIIIRIKDLLVIGTLLGEYAIISISIPMLTSTHPKPQHRQPISHIISTYKKIPITDNSIPSKIPI